MTEFSFSHSAQQERDVSVPNLEEIRQAYFTREIIRELGFLSADQLLKVHALVNQLGEAEAPTEQA